MADNFFPVVVRGKLSKIVESQCLLPGDTFCSFVTRVPRHGRKPGERVRLDKSGRLPVFINTLTLHESEPQRGDAVTKRVSRISSYRCDAPSPESRRVVFLSPCDINHPDFSPDRLPLGYKIVQEP